MQLDPLSDGTSFAAAAEACAIAHHDSPFQAAASPFPLPRKIIIIIHVLLLGRRLQSCKQQIPAGTARRRARQLRRDGDTRRRR